MKVMTITTVTLIYRYEDRLKKGTQKFMPKLIDAFLTKIPA
jgi:hypothetical protein